MSKIVIDTNILYSWVGISTNEKFTQNDIDIFSEKNELYITTASIIELLVKFRYDIEKIKLCLKPIIDERLLIIGIGFLPIQSEKIKRIYFSEKLSETSTKIDSLLQLKIGKEAEMLRFLLFCILGGMFNVIREDRGYKFSGQGQDNLFIHASNILLLSNSDFVYETFFESLKKGYQTNTEQQSVREVFSTLITSILNLWIMNYYFVKHSLLLDDFKNLDPARLESCKIDLTSDNFHYVFKEYIENPFAILSKKNFIPLTDKYINELKSHLKSHELITEQVLEFILISLSKSFHDGAKINKNDAVDLLIFYSLSLKGFKLITLDKKMAKAIEQIDKKSYALITSLRLTS